MKSRKLTQAAVFSAALMAAGTVGTVAMAPAASAFSVAGNYRYFDSFGDTNEPLTLHTNHTLVFATGCAGNWVTSAGTIAMSITKNCFPGSKWIFEGQVDSFGLSSFANPGRVSFVLGGVTHNGLWAAERV